MLHTNVSFSVYIYEHLSWEQLEALFLKPKLLLAQYSATCQRYCDLDTGACSLTGLTDLLMASMSPEEWLSGEAVSGVSWRAVSIGSGVWLLSTEVSGKIIGMERDLAWGDPGEQLGSGMTTVMRSLVPFLTYFTERERGREVCQEVSLVREMIRLQSEHVCSIKFIQPHTHTETHCSFQPLLRLL